MFTGKNVKKFVIVFLIISLIYANLSTTILGVISYAQEDTKVTESKGEEENKTFQVEISDFTKNEMSEKETEYQEKITLTPNKEKSFEKVTISDIETFIGKEIIDNEEENVNSINTFYRATKIDKLQLLDAMGIDGKLNLYYEILETENISDETENVEKSSENREENQKVEIPTGTIVARDGKTTIDRETETDENGYITVVYPDNTTAVKVELIGQIEKTEKIELVNNKFIEIVSDLDMIQIIKTTKQVDFENNNELISNTETTTKNIYYSKTLAELGVDKTQITTGVENKISFTITLHTDRVIYDLYKNPYFAIELPKEVKSISIDEAVALNNACFEGASIDIVNNETDKKMIVIKLEGEQTEYTNSEQENMQIVVNARIKTEEFMPTTLEQVNLYYQNENVTTYDGIEKQENGNQTTQIELASNKEVMVESKVVFGEESISSRENQDTIIMEPNSYANVTIIGTVINNVGEDIQNAKILGTVTNMGAISGVETVYYTENPNADVNLENSNNKWSKEFTTNAKKFLIVLDEFKQSEIVNFGYYMYLPQNAEEDIELEGAFEVYDNNNKVLNVSNKKILQEARKFNIYEDEQIKAQIDIENKDIIVGENFDGTIRIENKTNEIISGMEINIDLPENLERKNTTIEANGTNVKSLVKAEKNVLNIKSLNIDANTTVEINLTINANGVKEANQKLGADISYNNKKENIFDRVKIIEKPQTKVEATITSDKGNQPVSSNEIVTYKITLVNRGEADSNVDVAMPEFDKISIQTMESINTATGETKKISSGDLKGIIQNIAIKSGEKVEIYAGAIAKTLENDTTEIIYANIIGDNINETTTNKIVTNIQGEKKEKISSENDITNVEKTLNTITGIAWIDENENGQKDMDETLLTGIEAVLVDTTTSQEIAKEITNNKGEYVFSEIPDGNYVVVFKYDVEDFDVTNYTSKNTSNGLESNIVNATQNNETTAKTEVLKLKDGDTENINAGFVVSKKSEIIVEKKINKITRFDENGITVYSFENSMFPKTTKISNEKQEEVVLVEYEFKITNKGNAEGYITPLTEKIPEKMLFTSEINIDWYEGNDGKIYSSALINKKLEPGEEVTIKLILTQK